MGIAAGVAAAASVASAAAGIGSDIAGGSSAYGTYGGGNAGTYIPAYQAQADSDYGNLLQALNSNTGYLTGQVPSLQTSYDTFANNNPYTGAAQNGANLAGAYGTGTLFPQQTGAATSLYNAGNSVLGNAFDPQNALYNQNLQNVQGQSAVANAESGVQGPTAAGITDNNLNNFNINWQNDQLQRETQGIQSGGQAYAGASGLGGAGITNLTTSSALPYTTNLGQLSNVYSQFGNLANATTNAYAPELTALQSYLGLGQSATGIAQNGANDAFNQSQVLGNNIGSALSSLSNNQGLANLFSGFNNGAGAATYNSWNPGAYSSADTANTDIAAFYGQ